MNKHELRCVILWIDMIKSDCHELKSQTLKSFQFSQGWKFCNFGAWKRITCSLCFGMFFDFYACFWSKLQCSRSRPCWQKGLPSFADHDSNGPARLDRELQKYIWNGKGHLSLKDIWEYLNRYIYLPRVKDRNVLIKAVRASVGAMMPGPLGFKFEVRRLI